MTTVRLAHCGPPEALAAGIQDTEQGRPALLVSFVYLDAFLKHRHRYCYRDWVLDSGAWSAHSSGKRVELAAYMDTCRQLLSSDPTLTEVYALDVIGDWKASIANCEKMTEAGIAAIPTYHIGEPWEALEHIARHYPKIAIGGVAHMKAKPKLTWAGQCFARVWPMPIHGFGFGSRQHILALPFVSVDATNWEIGPCKFGRWNTFGNMSVRGSKQNLRAEVEWYLKLEREARARWRREMARLESHGPTMRLAVADDGRATSARLQQASRPTVRLAVQQSGDAQIAGSGLT